MRLRFALGLVVALWAGLALAQDVARQGPDYEAWSALAERAEMAIEAGEASTDALEALRDQIAASRARFLEAESAGQARVDTLESQLAALGPAPAEGETEPDDLAARRAQLEANLAEVRAPRRAATEAFNRAVGLVAEIDALIRSRQTATLLKLGPTPLNPVHWGEAVTSASRYFGVAQREITRTWSSSAERLVIRQNLPATLGLLAVGLMLFLNGRRWMQRATAATQAQASAVGRVSLGFLVSLGQIILPFLGILALVQSAKSTGLLGSSGLALLSVMPWVGLSIFGALWLGARLFPVNDALPAFLNFRPELRATARRTIAILGMIIGLNFVVGVLLETPSIDDGARAALGFPLIVALGYFLFRLGRLLRTGVAEASAEPEATNVFVRSVGLLARALVLLGIAGPLLAAVGYQNLSLGVMIPAVKSLGLMGALAVIHGPIRDIYALATGKEPDATSEALVPILISFAVTFASFPLFALIWGMRTTELADLWDRFLEGVPFGGNRLTPGDVLTVFVVFALGYMVTRLIQSTLKTTVLPRTNLDVGGRNAISAGVGYVGIFLAAVIAITTAGINLSSLAIVAGALSVGIGFGLQNIVSNFVSGIILLIERPISEGDWIEVGGQMGYVRNISVRSTRIETFDRTDVIVPNADLVSGTVTNWTRGNLTGRAIVPVGVAYGTDTQRVDKILREIAEASPHVAQVPPPNVLFIGFGADSLDFEIRAFLNDVNYLMIAKSEMNHEINRRFAEEGIEIPFAQRDVWLRNPEVLTGIKPEGT